MKKCFISCIYVGSHFKHYDMPQKFPKIPGFDYILFTNLNKNNFNTSWSIIPINITEYSKSITKSRYPKFQTWKLLKDKFNVEYDIIIYCDAYLSPINKPKIWDKVITQTIESPNGIVQSPHPWNKCPFKECDDIVKLTKDNLHNINKTKQLFIEKGLSKNSGLWENITFCYYTKNDNVKKLFNTLWELYSSEKYTHRDQPLYALAVHLSNITPQKCQYYMRGLLAWSGKRGNHSGYG